MKVTSFSLASKQTRCGTAVTLFIALTGVSPQANAQGPDGYPAKPIRLVVPAAPGGTSDILARTIGLELTKRWNQPVIVDNKPGADSNVGAELVAKAPPDGYTLLLLDTSTLTMGPSLYPKLTYDPRKDFAPITMIVFSPHVLGIHPSLPVNNVRELIAYSKSNPGKLNFASASNASRLGAAQFNLQTGTDMLIVPYKGGAASINAVAGGEANVILNGLLATLPQVKSGRIKGLATASARRMEATPDVPTVIESGVPGFVTGSWQGLLAPAGTPPEIVRKLNSTLVDILKAPDTHQKLVAMGAEVVADSPEDFGRFLRDETVKWTKVVKDAGIKSEQQ
ncbi:tripartite tricarboxylate transporter substrate binding protein [Variovorax rhizosphaerae]|uniref:Tripartite tricarboxylate transporter substrate binding protein n=1 Tax=Variovorax rhizosphaerae TaxID=1836200 RepID=A0ABU8WJN6_9BURK